MIPFEEASRIVLDHAVKTGTESIPLAESPGRILSTNIYSDIDFPSSDLSAMDGYATRKNYLDAPLRIIETIAAGQIPEKELRNGECARIMTGAMVPKGADCVVMFEHAKEENSIVTVVKISVNSNIRKTGEDLRKGDLVCKVGTLIKPATVASLAFSGTDPVPVAKQPVVGIISTGSELVEAASFPSKGKIRDSNGPQLCAQVSNAGALVYYVGMIEDRKDMLVNAIERALDMCDVLLLSGGVSVGHYDFVPEAIKNTGAEILFHSVSVKPGKPLLFAARGEKRIFGLPGNPVSVFVQFETLIKPLLRKMMGAEKPLRQIAVKLAVDIKRNNCDRMEFLPVTFNKNGECEIPSYRGSAHIHAYIIADGIISLPIGVPGMEKGNFIDVTLLE